MSLSPQQASGLVVTHGAHLGFLLVRGTLWKPEPTPPPKYSQALEPVEGDTSDLCPRHISEHRPNLSMTTAYLNIREEVFILFNTATVDVLFVFRFSYSELNTDRKKSKPS